MRGEINPHALKTRLSHHILCAVTHVAERTEIHGPNPALAVKKLKYFKSTTNYTSTSYNTSTSNNKLQWPIYMPLPLYTRVAFRFLPFWVLPNIKPCFSINHSLLMILFWFYTLYWYYHHHASVLIPFTLSQHLHNPYYHLHTSVLTPDDYRMMMMHILKINRIMDCTMIK